MVAIRTRLAMHAVKVINLRKTKKCESAKVYIKGE